MNTGNTILAVTGLVLVLSAPARAQTNTGEIGGVVRDESSGVLPGATVVAVHPASGFMVERVTDLDGRFFMSSLPIGEWDVTAELPGFRRAVQTGVVLAIGRTIDL
ncbi:MAG: carboxypeptidase-like regulatory domain-containing protein, partial [Vicinamibacterales bacterium]